MTVGSQYFSSCVTDVNPYGSVHLECAANFELCTVNCELRKTSGGYCGGVPPLPIPNREVKPACADGTAMQCGRVGGRLLLYTPPLSFRDERQGRFFCARFFPFGVSEYRYAGISIYRYVVILE